jgi:hypothetical protein
MAVRRLALTALLLLACACSTGPSQMTERNKLLSNRKAVYIASAIGSQLVPLMFGRANDAVPWAP